MTSPRKANNESAVAKEIQRGRTEMEREWQIRQQNVLPLSTAWNEGRFYGRALTGGRRLTGVQRVGLFLIGLQAIAVPLILVFGKPSLTATGHTFHISHHEFAGVPVVWLPVYLTYMLLGARFCWVALRRNQASKKWDGSSSATK
jgi:hypothetical protein